MLDVNHHKSPKKKPQKNNKTHASGNEKKVIVVHLWNTIVKWWWWTKSLYCIVLWSEGMKREENVVDVYLGPGVGSRLLSVREDDETRRWRWEYLENICVIININKTSVYLLHCDATRFISDVNEWISLSLSHHHWLWLNESSGKVPIPQSFTDNTKR